MPIEQGVSQTEVKTRDIKNLALPLFTHCAFVATEELGGEMYSWDNMIEKCKRYGEVPEEFRVPLGVLRGKISFGDVRQENKEGAIRRFSSFFDPHSLMDTYASGYSPLVRQILDEKGNSVLEWDITVEKDGKESINFDALRKLKVEKQRAPYFDISIDELGMHAKLKPL